MRKAFFKLLSPILLCCSVMLTGSLSLRAQTLQSATIQNGSNSNRLTVVFSEAITVSDNGAGFRLVGGVARIERLLSGSGSSTLTFVLTNYVLPGDAFKLLHWPEMSDARSASGKLGAIDRAVTNQVSSYSGSGVLYYVSTSGKDTNNGRSANAPFQSVGKALGLAQPGDFILLKRGDVWNQTNVVITKSGTANNYLTIAAYGSGNKPVIYSKGLGLSYRGYQVTGATFAVHGANYVQVDNLHIKTDLSVGGGGSDDGIQLLDCKYAIVSNCVAEAPGAGGYFGIRVNTWVYDPAMNTDSKEAALFNNTYPQVLNSEAFGYQANMGTQIWPYDGRHTILEGGLIENCISRDPKNPALVGGDVWENLMINRGDFNGFVIRKNKVYNYLVSGIETFGAKNVVVEYNEVFDPIDYDRGGKAIKAGGYNSASQTAPGVGELYTENITLRYNKIYNITQGNDKNVNAIDATGAKNGKIYGNLIYNVKEIGIKIATEPSSEGWDIYNNTVLDCDANAIQVYQPGTNGNRVRIKNNILQGSKSDIQVIEGNSSSKVVGANNILINKTVTGAYQSTTDIQSSTPSLFINPNQNNYTLKAGALAIDAGSTDIPPYPRDIRGFLINNKPDIGAFEFGSRVGPLLPPPNTENGVAYAYYQGNWTQLPAFSSLTPLKQGTLPNFSLSPASREDYYGFVYTTFLEVRTAGTYTFYTTSDDGSKLYVNEQLIVNNDGLRPAVEKSGSVSLAVGRHKVVVAYFEGYGGQMLEVRYAGPGIAKQLIPNDVLFLEDDEVPPAPVVTADAGSDRTVSLGSTVQLSGRGIGPNPFRAYLWEKVTGPNLTLTTRGANATLTNLQVGSYEFKFTATDSEGNSGSDNVKVTVTSSSARTASGTKGSFITESTEKPVTTLIAYPNPVNDKLLIQVTNATSQKGVLQLTNLAGQIVRRLEEPVTGSRQIHLDTRDIPAGLYLLQWQADCLITTKLLIEH